jgi:hypothetical protein
VKTPIAVRFWAGDVIFIAQEYVSFLGILGHAFPIRSDQLLDLRNILDHGPTSANILHLRQLHIGKPTKFRLN